jgi:hypothetical protein
MPAILVKPLVMSIYKVNGAPVPMPERMARATPDLKKGLYGVREALKPFGGRLVLSDLFRSYDMQLQAHLDFTSGKKSAFSPAPGGSMHESGRAFDVDLSAIAVSLDAFWELAKPWGIVPIIATPNPKTSECWHFERRGSHQLVHDHYAAGKAGNFAKPAAAMAASAIISVGLQHDKFKGTASQAYVQSALIRLGHDIGNMDGEIGPRSRTTLKELGLSGATLAEQISALDALLQQRFPDEFFDGAADEVSPFH